jgi:hypothetical protein
MERFNLEKLNEVEDREQNCVGISYTGCGKLASVYQYTAQFKNGS